MVKKYAENDFIELISEDSIIYASYKPETCINLDAAHKIIELLSSFCESNRYFILFDMNNLKWIDKSARDYIASHPVTNAMHAWAFHAKDPLHNVMYNIYITFSKPKVKTNFFINPEDGLKWLLSAEKE